MSKENAMELFSKLESLQVEYGTMMQIQDSNHIIKVLEVGLDNLNKFIEDIEWRIENGDYDIAGDCEEYL